MTNRMADPCGLPDTVVSANPQHETADTTMATTVNCYCCPARGNDNSPLGTDVNLRLLVESGTGKQT